MVIGKLNCLDMKKAIFIVLASLAAITACQKNVHPVKPSHTGSLYATMEEFTDTRTYMDADNNIRWSNGDRIIGFVFSTLGVEFQVNPGSVGETSATFDEVSTGGLNAGTELDHIIAYYPYSSSVKIAKSGSSYVLDVVLPAEQTYVPESFGNGAMPMMTVSETNNITFRNVCGGMKLQFKGTQKVASVKIAGNNGEKLSGEAIVTAYTDGAKPSISMVSNASTSVTLSCTSAVQLDEDTATEFIIALPPTVFTNGFTVIVTDYDGKTYEVETDKENEVIRSSLLVMPVVTLEESGQDESDDRWVDLGLSVLWAAYNVGASSPEEYGGYYAWGETEEKSTYGFESYIHKELAYDSDTDAWSWNYKYIGDEISGTYYDVAHVKWGDGARMPTHEEIKELVDNCCFEGGTYKGVAGNYVTGPNGNSIFLPFAGKWYYFDDIIDEGSYGYFWSGTFDNDNNTHLVSFAYSLCCYGDSYWESIYRDYGKSVRPVKEK